jgi:FADH2 O2-dependent halogenase
MRGVRRWRTGSVTSPFDLVVIGSGFAGSLLALLARRRGLSVLLLERGSHPRFVIGESTSPMTNLLLEEISREYDLPELLPLTAYGSWKRAYPHLGVGLKRGFSYYAHTPGESFRWDPERRNQLLVAASPNDEVSDTHWYRPDFDAFLVKLAQQYGVEYQDHASLNSVEWAPSGAKLEVERAAQSAMYEARFVVDASGPAGALRRFLPLERGPLEHAPQVRSLYSHFTGVPLFAEIAGTGGETPPFPPDDAALHHVFPGGWMWVLRFENGITSAGFTAEDWLADELGLAASVGISPAELEAVWGRFLDRFPSIGTHLREAERVERWYHAPRLAFRTGPAAGEGWALLPSSAAFVDPLFSTGFPLAILGVRRLAALLNPEADPAERAHGLAEYAAVTQREATTAARLVGGCYGAFADFPAFAALTMVYFAAASFSEMARRLDRPHLAPEFLLGGRPDFRALLERHTDAARSGDPSTLATLAQELEPFNVAGLCAPEKRNWYGVDPADVVMGAGKLNVTPAEVQELFRRMGL